MEIIFPNGYKSMFSPHFLVHKWPSEPVEAAHILGSLLQAAQQQQIPGVQHSKDMKVIYMAGHAAWIRLILEDVYNRYTHKITQVYQDSTHTPTYTYIYTHIYIYIWIYIHTLTYACMYVFIHDTLCDIHVAGVYLIPQLGCTQPSNLSARLAATTNGWVYTVECTRHFQLAVRWCPWLGSWSFAMVKSPVCQVWSVWVIYESIIFHKLLWIFHDIPWYSINWW